MPRATTAGGTSHKRISQPVTQKLPLGGAEKVLYWKAVRTPLFGNNRFQGSLINDVPPPIKPERNYNPRLANRPDAVYLLPDDQFPAAQLGRG